RGAAVGGHVHQLARGEVGDGPAAVAVRLDAVDMADRRGADAAGAAIGQLVGAQVAALAGGRDFPAAGQQAGAVGAQTVEVAGVLHVHFDPGGEAFGRKPVDRAEPAAVDVDV